MSRAPLVAVFLGTDHHPFDRLVRWVDELADSLPVQWFVQHGATRLPARLDGASMLGPTDLQDLLLRAGAVVCHGGPGLIMEARSVGHRPIVVARDPALGEHVDDHQQRFSGFVARQHLVTAVASSAALATAIHESVSAGTRRGDAITSNAASARFGSLVDTLVHRA